MADERDMSSATVVLAFLTGAAIGALAALVLAPQAGEATQRQLRGYARKAKKELGRVPGRADDVWGEVLERGREFLKEKKPMLAAAVEAGRKAMRRERERQTRKKAT